MLIPIAIESVREKSASMGGTLSGFENRDSECTVLSTKLCVLPLNIHMLEPGPQGKAVRDNTVNPAVKNKWGFKVEALI